MRYLRFASALGLALLVAGCIDSSTVINVKADGSGTIEQTMLMNAQAAAQLRQMSESFGQQGGAKKAGGLFNEADLRGAAAKMGEGVTFVSATPLKTAASEGTRAIYAFTDITKIRLEQKPASPGGSMTIGGDSGGAKAEDILFKFMKTPSGSSKVTVVFPEQKAEAARKESREKPATAAPAGDASQAAGLAMIKQMFNGLRISIVLKPAGRILQTNSPYVDGQQVTLLEMDFGQLLSDEGKLAKLQEASTIEEAKVLLKGVKGIKLNPDREVTVEFAGR